MKDNNMSSYMLKENKGSPPIPAGTHLAICVSVYDLGTQTDTVYERTNQKILIGWELPNERTTGEKDGETWDRPRMISRSYNASFNIKASLRKHLEAWRGRDFTETELAGFDLRNVLAKPCMLTVVNKTSAAGNQYAAIAAVAALEEGRPAPDPESPLVFFSMSGGDEEIPDGTPDWIKELIEASPEFQGAGEVHDPAPEPAEEDDDDDDLPF